MGICAGAQGNVTNPSVAGETRCVPRWMVCSKTESSIAGCNSNQWVGDDGLHTKMTWAVGWLSTLARAVAREQIVAEIIGLAWVVRAMGREPALADRLRKSASRRRLRRR